MEGVADVWELVTSHQQGPSAMPPHQTAAKAVTGLGKDTKVTPEAWPPALAPGPMNQVNRPQEHTTEKAPRRM